MTADQLQKLREPFEHVGKLPRVICKDCSQAQQKVCPKHKKSKCGECGNYITSAHIHLDYVGHAAVTDRLLQVDPEWTYKLMAANEDGSPVVFREGLSDPFAKVGIWIELTVCEVSTPGFGEGKNFKEAISDAIRNASMRRGVALDLWSKEDLGHDESGSGSSSASSAASLQTDSVDAGSAPGPGPERPDLSEIDALTTEYAAILERPRGTVLEKLTEKFPNWRTDKAQTNEAVGHLKKLLAERTAA